MRPQDTWTRRKVSVYISALSMTLKRFHVPRRIVESCSRFQHHECTEERVLSVVEKGEVTSVEEGQHVGRATVWLAERRNRVYDVSLTRGRPRRIHFVAVSLPEMLRVKKCWVASELDVATVRDDQYPVVVDLETFVCLPKNGNRQRKATKLCALRLRNQVCREAFQKDLEGIQGGTPCKHVDEHHAVCIRAIQDLARRHFESQKQGPRKHWISLRTWTLMVCVKVLQADENGV